jgi:hypothetical protein
MCIVMGADTALNAQPAASPGRCVQLYMKPLFKLTIPCLIFSTTVLGQQAGDRHISRNDSILFHQFWQDFKMSINQQNKAQLSKYFSFPFYCSPCIDYAKVKEPIDINNPPATVRVTKQIFNNFAYKFFFDIPVRNKWTRDWWLKDFVFEPSFDDNDQRNGFEFSFALVPPSKTWEGSQAFIYLKKKNSKILIVGIDHIP